MTDLVIPEEALESHLAILAKTGAGKSYTARGFLEWLLEHGRRMCVIDPIGVHWGIRLMADGETPAPYQVVIFGGDHGDVEIAPTAGAELAKVVASSNLPCVVDVSLMGIGERHRFFTEFANALMRHNRIPLHMVIDECHEFMPQAGYGEKSVDRGKMINAANRLVSGGRARGLRVMLISQRAAKVNKDSLTQVETLIAMRLLAKHDRQAVEGWVGACADPDEWKAIEKSLPKLEVGTGWVWAPALDVLEQVHFPLIETFDSFRAPDEAHAAAAPVALADVDLEQLRSQLGETNQGKRETKARGKRDAEASTRNGDAIEEAYVAARTRVAELEGELHDLSGRLIYEQRQHGALIRAVDRAIEQLSSAVAECRSSTPASDRSISTPSNEDEKISTPPPPPPRNHMRGKPPPPDARPRQELKQDPLVMAARSIWPVRLTWGQLTAMCGRKARGGHFNRVKRELLDAGVVREVDGKVELTDPPEMGDRIPADVLEEVLPGLAGEMFRAIRRQPYFFDVLGLGNHLGKVPRGGHWTSNMRILRSNDLVREDGGGALYINPDLESAAQE